MKLIVLVITLAAFVRMSPPAPTLTVDKIIQRESIINDIRPELIRAIIQVESGGNPDAVSPKNCKGIMQINPEHLSYFGYSEPDLFDVERNIIAGTRLLREELNRFGGEFDALRAYNCGSPKARKSTCGTGYARRVLGSIR